MSKNHRFKNKWTEADRFAFATQRLRATAIPSRRHGGPEADEWLEDDECECEIPWTGGCPACAA